MTLAVPLTVRELRALKRRAKELGRDLVTLARARLLRSQGYFDADLIDREEFPGGTDPAKITGK
jgi:hypothetical protein